MEGDEEEKCKKYEKKRKGSRLKKTRNRITRSRHKY